MSRLLLQGWCNVSFLIARALTAAGAQQSRAAQTRGSAGTIGRLPSDYGELSAPEAAAALRPIAASTNVRIAPAIHIAMIDSTTVMIALF